MPFGIYKHRSWSARAPWILTPLLALGTAGCLEFEKETHVMVFHPELNEARMLLVNEGLQVAGNDKSDLTRAEETLAWAFKDRQVFFIGFNVFGIDLRDQAAEGAPTEVNKNLEFLRRQLAISEARLFLNKSGKLCGNQTVVVRDLKGFVDGLNKYLSLVLAKEAAVALANPKQRARYWDDETLHLVQKAASNGYAWLRVEDSRISYRMPGTPAFFRGIKAELLSSAFLRGIHEAVKVSKPARPGKTESKPSFIDPTAARQAVTDVESVIRILSETAWSIEQRSNHITFVLGVGEDQPIRLTTETNIREPAKFQDQLLAKAKSMFPDLEKRVATEDVVARFLRENHVTSREP